MEPLREAQRKLGGGYVPHPRTSMERRKRGSPTAKTPPSSIIAEQKQVDEKKDALLPETSREWYPQQEVSINGQAFNLRFGEQRAHQFVEGVTEGNVFLYSPYTKMYQYPAAFRDGFFSSIAPLASTAAEHEMPIITGGLHCEQPEMFSYEMSNVKVFLTRTRMLRAQAQRQQQQRKLPLGALVIHEIIPLGLNFRISQENYKVYDLICLVRY